MDDPRDLPLNELVGRDREVAQVETILRSARLVTLTGLGGIGKTRVAREIVRRALDRTRRASLVDLSTVLDPALVVAEVLRRIGFADAPTSDPESDLIAALSAWGDGLLVLDNFEHLLDAAPLAATIARRTSLEVLITSRVALGVAGEREYSLGPLATDSSRGGDSARDSASGRLFLREAGRTGALDEVVERDDVAIARILSATGGLPLAIELAAARSRVLTLAAIADDLDASHDSRRADPLADVLDWTTSLLSTVERNCFLRLGAIPGTFDRSTAAAVASLDDPLVVLDRLIRVGLIRRVPGTADFEMLMPVRDYAFDVLTRDGLYDTVMADLAHYVLLFVRGIAPEPDGPDGARLNETEHVTAAISAALAWASSADPKLAVELHLRLRTYWFRLRPLEGRRLGEALLARSDLPESLARSLKAFVGMQRSEMDGPPAGEPLVLEALHEAIGAADHAAELDATHALAFIRGTQRRVDEALELLARCLALAEELDRPALVIRTLGNFGSFLTGQGRFAEARGYLERSVELSRQRHDAYVEATALGNLANVLVAEGDAPGALAMLDRAAELLAPLGPGILAAWVANERGLIAFEAGDIERARKATGEAVRSVLDAGGWEERAGLLENVAGVLYHAGKVEDGVSFLGAAERERRAAGQDLDGLASRDLDWATGLRKRARMRLGARRYDALARAWANEPARSVVARAEAALENAPAFRRADEGRYGTLSPRESVVLAYVADGRTDPEIADALEISPKTVSVHVSNLKLKLGVETRIEVAMAGRELQIAADVGGGVSSGRPER